MGLFIRQKISQKKKDDKVKVESTKSLEENLSIIRKFLKDCDDVVYKEFKVGENQDLGFTLIFTDGMIDKNFINESVMKELMVNVREIPPKAPRNKEQLYELVKNGSIPSMEIKEIENIDDAILAILTGDVVLLIDGVQKLLIIGAKGWPSRGISEPSTESVIKGPRDGFTETYRFNTALVRRRIRDSRLKLKQMQVGRRSFTDIGIMYIDDIAKPSLVEEVVRRLETIDVDAILESGYVEEFIEDNTFSLFPQVKSTERPDKVASALLEGRVAIFVDNSPFVIIVPVTMNGFFQASEDYYVRWIPATVLRVLRYVAGILSLVTPALYIAVTAYHPGILPTRLVLSIAAAREGVPFPALMEAFIMELTFELLREAGIRLPILIGGIVGIVGGLVVGQAAVEAGIVSPIMVIIVAVTAISSFSIPDYSFSNAFRLLRFLLIIAAGYLGLYGMVLMLLLILGHLVKLKSFGVPYLSPFVSFTIDEMKDTIPRFPVFMMTKRPLSTAVDRIRTINKRHLVKQVKEKSVGKDSQALKNGGAKNNDKE